MNRQFSKEQQMAIKHFTGPCMVVAGPGSGKTLVITHRIQNLIREYNVAPSQILVITFTKAAATEMQERFEKLMGGDKLPISFGTFHSVFFKILKHAYHYRAENILPEEEKYRILKELVDKEKLEHPDEKELISALLGEIGRVKGEMLDIRHYYSTNCSEEIFRRIYAQYNATLIKNNRLDFDDMLVMCYELFRKRKDILGAWQRKYPFILIDEFQDINQVQYEVMKMLAGTEKNLFVVGDDDQSIYRFRGARPEIMLNFEKDFPGTQRIVLKENHRCTKEIVTASLQLIGHNEKRFKKDIHAVSSSALQSENRSIEYSLFKNVTEENREIIRRIRQHLETGGNCADIAVLYRTNTGPRFLVDQLMAYNIPFHIKDAMPNIYEHFIAKDMISYIRLACGENTRENYLRIINKPNRYIAREVLRKERMTIEQLMGLYTDKPWMLERLDQLRFDLRMISQMSPFAAINYIWQGVDYEAYLEKYAMDRRMNIEELCDVKEEILQASKEYKTFEEWFAHIKEYENELARQSQLYRQRENAVELATMHSAKGLEYDIVYLPEVVEGVTPHAKSMLPEELEEERRLFYVAVTRARKELHVFSVQERFGKETKISRFVSEMQG